MTYPEYSLILRDAGVLLDRIEATVLAWMEQIRRRRQMDSN